MAAKSYAVCSHQIIRARSQLAWRSYTEMWGNLASIELLIGVPSTPFLSQVGQPTNTAS